MFKEENESSDAAKDYKDLPEDIPEKISYGATKLEEYG